MERKYISGICAIICTFLLAVCCEKIDAQEYESIIPSNGSLIDNHVSNDSIVYDFARSNDVLNKAYQLATLEWTPENRIPYRDGKYFEPGKRVKGVPYSSVKEINTYLFQDVSYHTFMTAVHNPKSVLYTEDISKAPYHGLNCAPYYGAVCSSSVMYALGFSIPYYANQIKDLPCMQRLDPQIIDSLKVCDVIWKSGHVQMIFDVEFRADTLHRISTFESSDMSAHINSYSKKDFEKIWNRDRYVGYRYKYLIYSEEPTVFSSFEPVVYNDDLSPSKGDKTVYRTDDTVIINIFNEEYDKIVLTKDSIVVALDSYSGGEYCYHDLQPGIYSVTLQNENGSTNPVSFEVIEIKVSYTTKDGQSIIVSFDSSATADYAIICDLNGNSLYFPISDVERKQGYINVPRRVVPESYCKVVFRGTFGSITNRPIRVL